MSLLRWEAIERLNSLHQQMYDLLHELIQVSYKSTLWISDSGTTQISAIQIRETDAKLILQVEIPSGSTENLEIEVTEEIVSIRGEQLKPVELRDYFDFEFYAGRFHSLIPLPALIQPQTVLTELQSNLLTLTFQKSWRSRCVVKVNVLDAAQLASEQSESLVAEPS